MDSAIPESFAGGATPVLRHHPCRAMTCLSVFQRWSDDWPLLQKSSVSCRFLQAETDRMMRLIAAVLALCLSLCAAETCTDPVISTSSYTTTDAVISSETVFIVELSLACGNGAQSLALYADVNGKQFPVTRGQDVGKYQVSWSAPHKQAGSGTYQVKFFDEESYSTLRKAQRNNEDVEAIKPLFTVNVDHRGAWSGPWVSTEVLAAVIGIALYYLAYSSKSSIQA
ncbi:translocon-associated protein subunit delta isoform X3 [Salminus brasiliensis]|uniref:translocon-associated protein subunit delta isoform X3 n=1 Tax=Salminus brasiliensis TaxID=930266 RepID=UPI003B82E93E